MRKIKFREGVFGLFLIIILLFSGCTKNEKPIDQEEIENKAVTFWYKELSDKNCNVFTIKTWSSKLPLNDYGIIVKTNSRCNIENLDFEEKCVIMTWNKSVTHPKSGVVKVPCKENYNKEDFSNIFEINIKEVIIFKNEFNY